MNLARFLRAVKRYKTAVAKHKTARGDGVDGITESAAYSRYYRGLYDAQYRVETAQGKMIMAAQQVSDSAIDEIIQADKEKQEGRRNLRARIAAAIERTKRERGEE